MLRDGERAVSLNDTELMVAAFVGSQMEIRARTNNWTSRFTYGGETFAWGKSIVGILAEMAFAKAFGIYYDPDMERFRRGDVRQFEIRWSKDGKLKVRDDEKPEQMVVLMTGKAPVFVVHGWIEADKAKQARWWAEPGGPPGAYFVPMEELWSLDTLPV